ncbi:Zn-dependent hydrolase [Spirulina subsalsa]|uniref:Zn-dependent hydrolase n=1 Tax=Spirulina subsalsa TaxID=54311 RepID=UPI0002ED8CC8|nr:allantoate amidohydrolase [Spirulina subsalsa]
MILRNSPPSFVVNRDRLIRTLEHLGSIGEIPNGGVCRLAYSPEDIAARKLVQQWMREAGMRVQIDSAGNIIGRYDGENPQASALATGSHLDTVPTGGRYDGALGILAGLEMVRVLQENQVRLHRPVEVIVFTDEEGTMIGSKAMSGSLVNDSGYYRRPDGTDIQTCLRRVGGDWDTIYQAKRSPQALAAFVELHVEQGPILESMGQSIGVVEGIVGQRRYQIIIEGQANHAGTTPMYLRVDALVTAAKIVLAVQDIGNSPGQQVATVGQLNVFPNAVNVIPGRVEMSLDIRDLSNRHLEALMEQLRLQLEEIANTTQSKIYLNPCLHNEPALAEPYIQQIIAQVCDELQLTYTHLPSRASHDAQELARITDMGMIFVPSAAGVSHAVTEYTTPEDCVNGAQVLLETFFKLGLAE